MALFCRSFRIVAVLVLSGKQPSSGLLQLCVIYLCVLAILCATVALFNIFYTSRKHFIFQAILLLGAITSTNVDGTASQTIVPGHHTLYRTGYEAPVCEWVPAATARLLLSPGAVESTPVLQNFDIFGSSSIWIFFIFFRGELLTEFAFC